MDETELETEGWENKLIYKHSSAGRFWYKVASYKRRGLKWYVHLAVVAGLGVGVLVAWLILQLMR